MLDARHSLDLAEITSLEALEALRPDWAALWDRCPTATPFQSPAWIIAWWRHFGQGELLGLALRRNARLVGFAPLFVCEVRGVRTVLPIGIGITDYLDALLAPEFAAEAAAAVIQYLADQPDLWDACDLQQLPPGSPLLDARAPASWQDDRGIQEACPVLDLPESTGQLAQTLSRSTVRHLRANRRRTDKVGEARVETVDDGGSLEEGLDALFRLHGARWRDLGHPGVLNDGAVRDFHREAAAALLDLGLLRLNVLRLSGRIAAVYYGFAAKDRAYAYLGGFDPTWAQLGLGSRVVGWSIEQAVREGRTEFHFLRGRESYKYKWGARDRFNYRRLLRRTAAADPGPS